MPEHGHVEMRQAAHAQRRRRRVVIVASVAGALALVVAIGAIIVGTFPAPSSAPVTAASATTAASQGSPARVVAKPASAPKPAAITKPANDQVSAKSPKATAVPSAPPAAPALPLGMASTLPGSAQMVVATGAKLGSTTGTLRIYNLTGGKWVRVFSAPCRFGTHGLIDGNLRKQGTRTTPTGIWQAGTFVWGWHAAPPAGTTMPYRQTTKNIWWSDESGSTYNTWVESSQHVSGEHLVDVPIQYEYAYSTGYNSPPNEVVEGRGTAIFLHVFDPPNYNNGLSAGCVAVSRGNMVRVLRTLEPGRHPSFAIGTESQGTSTSISAY